RPKPDFRRLSKPFAPSHVVKSSRPDEPSRQCKRVSIPPDIEVLLCRLAFSDSYLHSHFQLFGQSPHAAERRRSPGRPRIGIRMPCRNVGAESTERSSCRSISFVSARITRSAVLRHCTKLRMCLVS